MKLEVLRRWETHRQTERLKCRQAGRQADRQLAGTLTGVQASIGRKTNNCNGRHIICNQLYFIVFSKF